MSMILFRFLVITFATSLSFAKLYCSGVFVDETIQCNRCQIADSDLVRRRILDNFSAQIRTLDCSQILLIRFAIAVIFVNLMNNWINCCQTSHNKPYMDFQFRFVPRQLNTKEPELWLVVCISFLFRTFHTRPQTLRPNSREDLDIRVDTSMTTSHRFQRVS